jgi:hypothetical protein
LPGYIKLSFQNEKIVFLFLNFSFYDIIIIIN